MKELAASSHYLTRPKTTFPSKLRSFHPRTAAPTIVLLVTVMETEQMVVQISANLNEHEQKGNGVYSLTEVNTCSFYPLHVYSCVKHG